MTNNDILRRIRYTFNFNDKKMIALFALADLTVTREQISAWLKKEDDSEHVNISDVHLATFLNGLINDKRGKKEGPQPVPEKRITNNIVLTKLKIALNLKAEDIIEIIAASDFNISKSELSAFFRKPDHKHFRQCKDQFLRNFIQGLDKKYHVARPDRFKTEQAPNNTQESLERPSSRLPKKYGEAKAKASKVYVNPNAKVKAKENTKTSDGDKPARKVLKLKEKIKPKDIWGD